MENNEYRKMKKNEYDEYEKMKNNEYGKKILESIARLVAIEKALEKYIREESKFAPDEQDVLRGTIINSMALTMKEIRSLDKQYKQSLAEHDSGTYKEANSEN